MNTIASPDFAEVKTELPIEYVEYEDPTYGENPSSAPVEDVFAGVGNTFELISEIKVEPGIVGALRDTITPVGDPLTCRFCQMKFNDREFLDAHVNLHMDNDIYLCTKCNFKCATDNILIDHYKAFENDVSVPCVICKEEFSRMCFLLNHMEEHGKNKIRPSSDTLNLLSMDEPITVLSCENCDYKTATQGALQAHLEPNEVGNLIKCNMCKEQFSLRCDFYNHMKEHMAYIIENTKVSSNFPTVVKWVRSKFRSLQI